MPIRQKRTTRPLPTPDAAPLSTRVGARSDVGRVREENQDRISRFRCPLGEVFLVVDGMGGHRDGARAATMVVEGLERHLQAADPRAPVDRSLREAAVRTHREIQQQSGSARDGMGATAVLALVRGRRVVVAHAGDSRAYLFRGARLLRLTRDHTLVQRMVDDNLLSEEEARNHPDSSVVSRAFGRTRELELEIAEPRELFPGDRLLLCSDGLSGFVDDAAIAGVMADRGAREAAEELVELALAAGGEDNVSVQVVAFGPSEGTAAVAGGAGAGAGAGPDGGDAGAGTAAAAGLGAGAGSGADRRLRPRDWMMMGLGAAAVILLLLAALLIFRLVGKVDPANGPTDPEAPSPAVLPEKEPRSSAPPSNAITEQEKKILEERSPEAGEGEDFSSPGSPGGAAAGPPATDTPTAPEGADGEGAGDAGSPEGEAAGEGRNPPPPEPTGPTGEITPGGGGSPPQRVWGLRFSILGSPRVEITRRDVTGATGAERTSPRPLDPGHVYFSRQAEAQARQVADGLSLEVRRMRADLYQATSPILVLLGGTGTGGADGRQPGRLLVTEGTEDAAARLEELLPLRREPLKEGNLAARTDQDMLIVVPHTASEGAP